MAECGEIVRYLNDLLRCSEFKDFTSNGLQIEGAEEVRKIGFAVDPCLQVFEELGDCQMIVTHHPILFHARKDLREDDPEGAVLESWGDTPAYCRLIQDQVFSAADCEKQYVSAAALAYQLGEAYIFACHGGLFHIAYPLSGEGQLCGAVLCGPFLMDQPDSSALMELDAKKPLTNRLALSLYDEMGALPVWPPERVTQASRLMHYMFAPLISEGREEIPFFGATGYGQTLSWYGEIAKGSLFSIGEGLLDSGFTAAVFAGEDLNIYMDYIHTSLYKHQLFYH